MKFSKHVRWAAVALASFLAPVIASAHEVYVLSKTEIAADLLQPPVNLFAVAVQQKHEFFLWGMIGFLVVLTVLGMSISRGLEKVCDPFLLKIKPYASHLAQITFGVALLASAYHGALFGTELPFAQVFGSYTTIVTVALYIAGASVLFGVFPRFGSLLTLVVFLWAAFGSVGSYMLSYATYFGEGLVIALFGGYAIAKSAPRYSGAFGRFMAGLKKRKFFIMRALFATSLLYAALYAKLIHGALALNTVNDYHLTKYFHFAPLFIVLGAFLIEMSIGLFYLLGFELRFTSLFFLTFLTMSLVFFGETVWPHYVLIGTAISMFVHGYDEYTVERFWYKKGKREPVF